MDIFPEICFHVYFEISLYLIELNNNKIMLIYKKLIMESFAMLKVGVIIFLAR